MADALVADLGEGFVQQPPLTLPADHRRVQPSLVAGGRSIHLQEPEGLDGCLATLDRHLAQRLDLHGVADKLMGLGRDQDLARLGGLLEAGRDVHCIAGDQSGASSRVACHHLAGGNPGPPGDRGRTTGDCKLAQRFADLGCGPDCSERVVLVHAWDTEDGHGRVTDEFLDHAAVGLDDGADSIE